jgi:ubiquinone biosynthesis O-methyltransferase
MKKKFMTKLLNYKPTFDFQVSDSNQKLLDELYDYGSDLSTRVFHRMRINMIYSLLNDIILSKMIKQCNKALDIGCNSGFISKIIAEFDFNSVYGLDLSDDYIQKATLNFGNEKIQFRTEDATKLEIREKFDLILCTEVIEHTDKPVEVIKAIHRLLSDDGIAIISMPNRINFNYLTTYLGKKLLGRVISNDLIQHLNFPFYKTIQMFKNENFKVIKTKGVNFLLLDSLLPFSHKNKLILEFDSYLSGLFPFKFFSQFFFLVIKK